MSTNPIFTRQIEASKNKHNSNRGAVPARREKLRSRPVGRSTSKVNPGRSNPVQTKPVSREPDHNRVEKRIQLLENSISKVFKRLDDLDRNRISVAKQQSDEKKAEAIESQEEYLRKLAHKKNQ